MPSSSCRVLVVEDDGLFRGVLAEALRDEGFDVRSAGDGFEALEILHGWGPDLILLDLELPLMNGVAFRSHQSGIVGTAEIPVVVLSARGDLRAQAAALGEEAILSKPCDLNLLVETITRRLGSVEGAPRAAPS